jgi:protein-arginine kinase activator protein McsA
MDKERLKAAIQQSKILNLESSKKQGCSNCSSKQNSQPSNFPSLASMGVNLAKDVVNTVKSGIAGQGIQVDEAESNKRKQICDKCEFFNTQQQRCTKCGCFMAVKVYLKASHCPVGKW